MFARRLAKLFCSVVPKNVVDSKPNIKRIFLNIAAGALSGGLGIYLYDFATQQNLRKMDEALGRLMSWDPDWDLIDRNKLPPEAKRIRTELDEVQKKFPSKKRHVILVRHGQSEGQGLSKVGEQQAAITASVLKNRLNGIPIRCILSAESLEAKSTADILNAALQAPRTSSGPYRLTSGLFNEGIGATPEPPIAAEIETKDTERFEDAFFSFFGRPNSTEEGNISDETADIVVTHGNIMRHFLCLALQLDPRAWLRFAVNNGGFIWLEIEANGRVTARSVANDSAIPKELITYS